MITITHTVLTTSFIAIVLSFLYGRTIEKLNVWQFFFSLFVSLLIGIVSTVVAAFLHSICEDLSFCAKTHDMNVFHVLIPVMYFPVFWFAMLFGYEIKPFPMDSKEIVDEVEKER